MLVFSSYVYMVVLPARKVCAPCACSTCGSQKRASDSPGTRFTDGSEWSLGCWELNPGPLEE